MMRPLGLFGAAVLCVLGCKAPAPTVNPFIGRTRIPPPQTGAAGQSPAPPYYPNSPTTPAPGAPPAYQSPAPATPTTPAWPSGSVPPNYQFPSTPTTGQIQRSPEIRAHAGTVYLDEQVLPASTVEVVSDPRNQPATGWSTSGNQSPATDEPSIRVPQDSHPLIPSLAMPAAAPNQSPAIVDQPIPTIARGNQNQVASQSPFTQPPLAQPTLTSQPPAILPKIASAEPRPNYIAPSQSVSSSPIASTQNVRPPVIPTAWREPAALQPDPRAVEISELPRTRQFAYVQQPHLVTNECIPTYYPSVEASAPGSREAVPTLAGTSASEPTAARPTARYRFDRQYAWLSGKLEYSSILRQWKLRYIPIDGDTDTYGGSVIIANAEVLKDWQPGDFVTVEGKLTTSQSEATTRDFAPTYHITRIRNSDH